MTEYKNNVDLKLKKYVENIEALEEEKKDISDRILEVYKEAKAAGFDVKTMRKVVSLRRLDQDKRIEQAQLLETYKEALGMAE